MTPVGDYNQFGALDTLGYSSRGYGGADHIHSSLHNDQRLASYPPEIIEQFIRPQEEVVGKKMQLNPHSRQNFWRCPCAPGC